MPTKIDAFLISGRVDVDQKKATKDLRDVEAQAGAKAISRANQRHAERDPKAVEWMARRVQGI